MLRNNVNNADARRCSYFELRLPVRGQTPLIRTLSEEEEGGIESVRIKRVEFF